MRRTILIFSFLIFTLSTVFSQTFKAYVKAGEKATAEKDFYSAMVYFKNALEIKENSTEVMYKYAEVARQFHSYEQAAKFYKKVLSSENKDEFPLSHFWLAKVQKSQGDYASAIRNFENYISRGNSEVIAQAKKEIEDCRWAIDLIALPDETEVSHLNKRVNSSYSEFGPIMKGDTLFFSSYKFNFKKDNHSTPRRQAKLLYSVKGSKGKPMKRYILLIRHLAKIKNGFILRNVNSREK